MSRCWNRLWKDEAGVIISAELVLILTIVVLGVIVGLVQVRTALVSELHDIGLAFSHLNQSYAFCGFRGTMKWWGSPTSWTAGSSFYDLYDGTNSLAASDVGVGVAYATPGFGAGGPGALGYGGAIGRAATVGTIVLADGTFIPLTLVASGTWSLPGGGILAATSANANLLLLADGSTIPFIYGAPGTVSLADGKVVAARPGAAGTLVLADGTIAVLDPASANSATLPDGTVVTFQPVNSQFVVLSNGTVVAVTAFEKGTLILTDGRALNLRDAVLPAGAGGPGAGLGFGGSAVARTSSFGTIVLSDGTFIPLTLVASGTWSLPGGTVLAATGANATTLVLADGSTIPFIDGRPGIVVDSDGKIVTMRVVGNGTIVLANGTVAVIQGPSINTAKMPNGTLVTFQLAGGQDVVLADGTLVAVQSYEKGMLTLSNGRALNLRDAVRPPWAAGTDIPQGSTIRHGSPWPHGSMIPHCNTVAPVLVPDVAPHRGGFVPPPAPQPQSDCCQGQPGLPQPSPYRSTPKHPTIKSNIPQGPAPQNVPQL